MPSGMGRPSDLSCAQTSEFRQMKDDVGSEGACDAFMEQIREADDVDRAATSVHMDSLDGIEDSNADSWL